MIALSLIATYPLFVFMILMLFVSSIATLLFNWRQRTRITPVATGTPELVRFLRQRDIFTHQHIEQATSKFNTSIHHNFKYRSLPQSEDCEEQRNISVQDEYRIDSNLKKENAEAQKFADRKIYQFQERRIHSNKELQLTQHENQGEA